MRYSLPAVPALVFYTKSKLVRSNFLKESSKNKGKKTSRRRGMRWSKIIGSIQSMCETKL